jgi:hypothetical protein
MYRRHPSRCFQEEDVLSLAPSQESLAARSRPPFEAGRKRSDMAKALLGQWRKEAPAGPSRARLAAVAQRQGLVPVSVRPRHRWRVPWRRNRPQGRPRHAARGPPVASGTAVVRLTPRLSCVGGPLFAHGRAHQGLLATVVEHRTPAVDASKRAHPSDALALVHHRAQTRRRRVHALGLAPLCGLARRTACATHAPPRPTLLGQGEHSAPLRQCRGPLERVEAAAALWPALVPAHAGHSIEGAGPRLASGSRGPMPTGPRTLLGRLLAGAPAGIAQDAAGPARFGADDPPAVPVSPGLVASGAQVAAAPGTARVVSDRAVHAGALARACDAKAVGVLCRLAENAPQGLARVEAPQGAPLEEGPRGSRGPWPAPQPEEPRPVVMVEPVAGTPWVSGATPQVEALWAVTAGPRVSRERHARPAHRVKRMLDPGALHTHDGRKQMGTADRPQPRAREQLERSLATAQHRVAQKAEAGKAPQHQGAVSASQGPGQRLAQRQAAVAVWATAWQDAPPTHAPWAEPVHAVGPSGPRAERDGRTQTILTMRTLVLEQAWRAFLVARLGTLQTQVRVATILPLLFERSGARIATRSQGVYWGNTAGLSVPYRHLLTKVVEGLCAMDLQDQGKPMYVRLKDMSP